MKIFKNSNSMMTDSNKKQALKPKGSNFIKNELGTAPGIYIEKNFTKIIMLPGPPMEMEFMFEKNVKNLIKEDFNIITQSINIIGIGESSLECRLDNLNLNSKNTSILTFAKQEIVEISIVSKGKDKKIIENEVINIVSIIKKEFNGYIYPYDHFNLEEIVINLLNKKNITLAVCESITGGMISSKLTKVEGASNVFNRGIISYSNISKIDELGVKRETLEKYGPVSEEVAYEMAKGLFNKSKVDIALSTTGLAGPSGASKEKPIGLVYICIVSKKFEKVFKFKFNGNRNSIQEKTTNKALNELINLIK